MLKEVNFSKYSKLLSSLFLGLLAFSFIGCQQESPNVQYQGLSAQSAITLLKTARTADQKKQIINRVSKDPRYGFDWREFWSLAAEDDVAAGLDPSLLKFFFSLSKVSCQKDSHSAFAQAVFKYPDYHDLLLGDDASCYMDLPEEPFVKYFNFYKERLIQMSAAESSRFVNLLTRQQVSDSTVSIKVHLDTIPMKTWGDWILKVLVANQAPLAMRTIDIYESVYGASGLAEMAIVPVLSSPLNFRIFLDKIKMNKTVDLLNRLPRSFYLSDKNSYIDWQQILTTLSLHFEKETYFTTPSRNSAELAFQDYVALHQILLLLEGKLSYEVLLSQYDLLTRKMETYASAKDNEDLFAKVSPSSLLLWLKYRAGKKVSMRELDQVLRAEQTVSRLQISHHKRLQVHISEDWQMNHSAIRSYCSHLQRMNVTNRKIDINDFRFELLQKPGCVELVGGQEGQEVALEFETLQMSMSSVLMTGGVSLKLSGQSFDASIIDLTSTLSHQNLLAEPPQADDGAVAFPVLFGFRIRGATDFFPPGTYYLVSHLTWRKATDGRASAQAPVAGYPGGHLLVEAEEVLPLKAISLGGPGQKAAPRRAGGEESVSIVDRSAIRQDMSGEASLLSRPDLRRFRYLLENAEKNLETNKINIYMQTEVWWKHLSYQQKQKVIAICGTSTPDTDCSHDLAKKAATQIVQELKNLQDADENYVLPRLADETYTESAGLLGSMNEDGAEGQPGAVEIVKKGITQ